MKMTDFGNLMGILSIAVFAVEALTIVQYVLRSLSLYTVAKRRGIPNPGYAWVPLIWTWTLGAVCDQYDETRGIQRKWRTLLLTLTTAAAAVFLFAYIATLAQTVAFINSPQYPTYDEAEAALAASMGSSGGFYLILMIILTAASALNVCLMICVFKFFESCRPKDAVKYLLLSLLVPFAQPFCLMCCRNYDLGLQKQELPPYNP